MKIYYVKIEARYTVRTNKQDDDGEDYVHSTKIVHSEHWYTMDAAMACGNAFIESNKWLEQYPGYVGQRLHKGFGGTLVGYSLKNGAQVYISIETHDTPDNLEGVLDFLKGA